MVMIYNILVQEHLDRHVNWSAEIQEYNVSTDKTKCLIFEWFESSKEAMDWAEVEISKYTVS